MTTISENQVKEEFFFTKETITSGIESGALKFQYRTMHGNSYRVFYRNEIEEFAKTELADPDLKATHDAKQMKKQVVSKKSRLEVVTKELNGLDARKVSLTNEAAELNDFLLVNDKKTKAAADKEDKKRKREQKK